MGKQGPCCHCGVASTPLWRNGPPEKPVLCNACGSRWRTKGTLANYTPLHARADADDYEDHRVSKMKSISLKKKDEKLSKRKLSYESNVGGRFADHSHSFQKSIDEDTGYRSSSGSAISNSESCAHFGSVEASDLTGPAQSIAWEAQVPSRKRTCVTRPKQSSVEKLTRDLHTILHEQQSSYLSGSSEEDLLFESDTPMVSVEIGHGSVLMKHPSSLGREEESEASSLSFENKHCAANEVYSHSTLFTRYNDCKGQENHFHDSERFKKLSGHMRQPEPVKRDKPIQERTQQLWHRNSPLCSLDLNDVVNVEVLVEYFTREEQQQLLKYLPSDTSPDHDSLRSMFECRYFKEDLSSFQQLVSEGIFSNNFSGVDVVDFKTLKKLILSNLTKTKWLELYNKLKGNRSTVGIGECSYTGASGSKSSFLETSWNAKKLHNIEDQDVPGVKLTIKSPSRAVIKNRQQETKESSETNGLFFSPKSLFMTMPREDGGLLMLDSNRFGNESSDQDILLDVPSNCSFPEAEFLLPTSSFAPQRPSAGSSSTHPLSHP